MLFADDMVLIHSPRWERDALQTALVNIVCKSIFKKTVIKTVFWSRFRSHECHIYLVTTLIIVSTENHALNGGFIIHKDFLPLSRFVSKDLGFLY